MCVNSLRELIVDQTARGGVAGCSECCGRLAASA